MITRLDNDCYAHDTVNFVFINGVCVQLQLQNLHEVEMEQSVLFTFETRNYEDLKIKFHVVF